VRHLNYYTMANSNFLEISISGMPVVESSLTLSSSVSSAIPFRFYISVASLQKMYVLLHACASKQRVHFYCEIF